MNTSGMNLQQLHTFPTDRVRALFGLEPTALGALLAEILPPLLERRLAQQQKKKGLYLRHNASHAVCGAMFGVSADISENTFAEVVLLLRDLCPAHRFDAERRWTRREPSWHPDTLDVIPVDSFETPVCRPSLPDVQREFHSGKKKRHTMKTQIVTDKRGEVLAIEPGFPGPLPDKTLYEQSEAAGQYPQAAPSAQSG